VPDRLLDDLRLKEPEGSSRPLQKVRAGRGVVPLESDQPDPGRVSTPPIILPVKEANVVDHSQIREAILIGLTAPIIDDRYDVWEEGVASESGPPRSRPQTALLIPSA
jgi:hypothetical protein